jgi:hypothetical protein
MNKTAPTIQTITRTHNLFSIHKVLLIKDLTRSMQVSARTVYRYLKEWNTCTSYNFNGSYYTLQNIAEFDQNGLWVYKNIRFSKYGNLTTTIEKLVENSTSGLTMQQLNTLLDCALHSILPKMAHNNLLFRQKHNGVYVYFAINPEMRNTQITQLSQAQLQTTPAISCETAIKILVLRIQHPDMELGKFVKKLHQFGVKHDEDQLQMFFEFHGIEKKTKGLR